MYQVGWQIPHWITNDEWPTQLYHLQSQPQHFTTAMITNMFILQHKSRSSPAKCAETSPAVFTMESSHAKDARWEINPKKSNFSNYFVADTPSKTRWGYLMENFILLTLLILNQDFHSSKRIYISQRESPQFLPLFRSINLNLKFCL